MRAGVGSVEGVVDRAPADSLAEEADGLGALVARTAIRMSSTVQRLSVWLAAFTVFAILLTYPSEPEMSTRLAALGFGLIGGLLAWVVAAIATNRAVLPERANSRSFSDLGSRVRAARRDLEGASAPSSTRPPSPDPLDVELENLERGMARGSVDPDWIQGLAYVNRWRQLHRVEAELILRAELIRQRAFVLHDELRIEGSKLDHDSGLVRQQIDAVNLRLKEDPLPDVRPLIQEIRSAVNDFRDRRFEALVRATGTLNSRTALLGLAAWTLLALAILTGASIVVIASVAAFYLVGVAAGLLTQLRGNRMSSSLEDVYGYGEAHLRQTVLLSGLAAIVGVALTWVAANGTTEGVTVASLSEALSATPTTLATAALFGFAPGVLLDRFSGWAKANVKELEDTLGSDASDSAT